MTTDFKRPGDVADGVIAVYLIIVEFLLLIESWQRLRYRASASETMPSTEGPVQVGQGNTTGRSLALRSWSRTHQLGSSKTLRL